METNKVKKAGEQPKRRACDECRGRKLACSKDIRGCARCNREGIQCVYSAQKPMGRPRKRPNAGAVRVEIDAPKEDPQAPAPEQGEPVATVVIPEFDPTMAMELDLSFLDMGNELDFMALIEPHTDFSAACCLPADDYPPPSPPALLPPPLPTAMPTPPEIGSTTSGFWSMGDHLGHIDFNSEICSNPNSEPAAARQLTPEEIAMILSPETPDNSILPGLSPPSSISTSAGASPASPDIPQTCSCLASLYLSLESVKTLPQSVPRALRVTRAASRAAHDAVLCPICGDIPLESPLDLAKKPPMASIQTMMMLGALLPSLSSAYMSILKMIDAEAAAADAARRRITFTLAEYGGLWGVLAEKEPFRCGAAVKLEGALMEPSFWRLTIRALLKVDVYGVDDTIDCPDMRQIALKDIIGMLEERSRNRHQMLDEMVAAGIIDKPCNDYIPLSSSREKPTCLRIIDMAKRSMDELVIP